MRARYATLILTSLLASFTLQAKQEPFVGNYRQGSVDTLAEFSLLPDHTFCFGFMGGDLDLLLAGQWQHIDANTIHLKEYEQKTNAFFVANDTSESDLNALEAQVKFYGHSLAADTSIVFGTSQDKLRPVLSQDYNGFRDWYTIPVNSGVKSIFVGRALSFNADKITYQIAEYAVDLTSSKVIKIAFNRDVQRKPIDTRVKLEGNQLISVDSGFGAPFTKNKQALSVKTQQQISQNCIAPARSNNDATKWAQPLREFQINLTPQELKPYYQPGDEDYSDSSIDSSTKAIHKLEQKS